MPHLSLALALTLSVGIACGVLTDAQPTDPLSLALALSWAGGSVAFFRGWPRVQLAAIGVTVFAAGWLLGDHALERAMHPPLRNLLEERIGGFAIDGSNDRPESPIVIEGQLSQDAAPSGNGVVLRVQVKRVWIGPCPEPTAGGVSLSVGGGQQAAHLAEWRRGRVLRAPAMLRRPARHLNHGVPDQERALARRGIALVGNVKSAALVEVIARGRWWEEAAASLRARTRAALDRHVRPLGEQSAAVATAILIGDRAGIDIEVERRLQEAGTYHVIAISGGNIAILAGLQLGILAWLGIRGWHAPLATVAVLIVYAAVASGGASVARATMMACVYLGVRALDHRTAPSNAIGLAGATLLLIDPLAIADVGFWLTFGATAAIVVGASRVRWPGRLWLKSALAVLLASACAELVLAPIGALVFQRVTLAGLLLNFVAIPAMTLVQLGAMAVVLFDLLGLHFLAGSLGNVVHAGGEALTGSARFLDLAPWLTWRVPSPAIIVTASYYGTLGLVLGARRLPRRRAGLRWVPAAAAAILFIVIIAAPQARIRARGDGRLHASMVDVGQGDALLITFPNGRRLVVDTGGASGRGDFDIGDRVVGPMLRALGVLNLDYLAVTHGDPDHIGGARALVRDFSPREIWWGIPVANHEATSIVSAEAGHVRATWRWLQRGDRFEVGGVEIRVHHPPLPDWERQKTRNNDSLVLELRFGAVSVLLTGDIDREVERELLPILDLLSTVVLKVAHHGSNTSSGDEFVQHTRPKVALIGVGRANPYGHPVPHVLERFKAVGTEVFRTDLDGQVTVSTDGRSLRVETFTGRSWEFKRSHEGHEGTKEILR